MDRESGGREKRERHAGQQDQHVVIIEDDDSLRSAMRHWARLEGYATQDFASAEEYLADAHIEGPTCLILDEALPGMRGLELLKSLPAEACNPAIIVLTASAEPRLAVHAMKLGAVDYIVKPCNDERLRKVVQEALKIHRQRIEQNAERMRCRERHQALTPRERDVFERVVRGSSNSQVAEELGVSIKTIEVHRARVMQKMGAGNLADLIRIGLIVLGSGEDEWPGPHTKRRPRA